MKLIDTHAHLYWESFKEDFEDMIGRAVSADITAIINIGVDVEKSRTALEQAQNTKWPQGLAVFSSIGIHPHEVQKPGDIEKLEEIYLSNPKKVIAVGECGLDYKDVDETAKQLQKPLFQAQIDLAKKLNLPLVVHCREAWDETLKMIGNYPAILHCYSGLPHTTNYILQTSNLIVSFAANITYPKNEYLRHAAKSIPLNKILLETDSPFLAPQSKRGQRNEPSSVVEIAQLIAELRGISVKEVASWTNKNAEKAFRFAI